MTTDVADLFSDVNDQILNNSDLITLQILTLNTSDFYMTCKYMQINLAIMSSQVSLMVECPK